MAVCGGTRRDGTPCTANPIPGERWCYHHHPDYIRERRASARRAASLKHSSIGKELREVRELIWELLGLTSADRLPHRARRELQNVVQLLQCYLRAAELEMREAEEPLRGNLDVAGLKAQVLKRIEELEVRELEREGLLAELVPAIEAWGYDTQAVKAVMGG
jgi:hypothetical protein